MKIILLDAKTLADSSLLPLESLGKFTSYPNTTKKQIVTRCADADVIVTNKVVIDRETLSLLPNLKLICVAATGTNNIDLNAAKEHQVTVCNVAGYSTASVVQHTFTLLGNLLGNMHRYLADTQAGEWQKSDIFCRLDYPITEIANKEFVIIGYGTLGKAVANVATAFGANVTIAERPNAKVVRDGRVPFSEAIKAADIISIHCPLNEETTGLFNEDTFSNLKPSVVLLNTARGGVVDEHALIQALNKQQIAGAAFDVLSKEPAQNNNPLLTYQGTNLLLTPHTAWAAKESIDRLIQGIADNITHYFNNEPRNKVV